MEWCTIESDPGVFNELIKKLGVENVMVHEVLTLEDEAFMSSVGRIFGFIFLFKWDQSIKRELVPYDEPEIYFAKQMVTNACATQAMISILMNCPDIRAGEMLNNLKMSTMEFDPELRGESIGSMDEIRVVHNSFARPESFQFVQTTRKATKKDDVFHFVAYIPFNGKVFELDGLQRGPNLLGNIPANGDWVSIVKTEIEKRAAEYSANEIRFNLLALAESKKFKSDFESKQLEKQKGFIYRRLAQLQGEGFSSDIFDDYAVCSSLVSGLETNPQIDTLPTIAEAHALLDEINRKIQELRLFAMEEEERVRVWEVKLICSEINGVGVCREQRENARRKHDYIPFILKLLELSAQKGDLAGLINEAKEKKEAREKASAAAKKN